MLEFIMNNMLPKLDEKYVRRVVQLGDIELNDLPGDTPNFPSAPYVALDKPRIKWVYKDPNRPSYDSEFSGLDFGPY